MDQQLIVRRRRIDPEDLDQIRRLIAQEGQRGRSHISNQLCALWDWRQANGHFREIACRDLLRRLEAKGLIELPPMMARARRTGYTKRVRTPELLDRAPLHGSMGIASYQFTVELVQSREQAQLFTGLIDTYHYLGYQPATGARLKYLARHNSQPIACLSFGPAAYKVAPRDQWIGWNPERRQERLSWLVNNDRFLVLPWVQVRGLASFLLSQCVRRLPTDWRQVYSHDLALAETFIQRDQFMGACYSAANWHCVGSTRGRGRNDIFNQRAAPPKCIWLYALRKDFREILCA